jgi:hypothetical protein
VAFQFPGKTSPVSEVDLLTYSPLLQLEDFLTDKVIAKGTSYSEGQILVIKAHSADVLEVGLIMKIVIRKDTLLFLVSVHDAARNRFRFFQSLPAEKVDIVNFENLADYKPLVRRGDNICFPFILHHHIPTQL